MAVQLSHRVELGRAVPRQLFWPQPKVESVVVHGRLREDCPEGALRRGAIALARTLFTRRRQGLRRVLGDHLGDRELAQALLEGLGVDPAKRAETLEPVQWMGLAEQLLKRSSGDAQGGREENSESGGEIGPGAD